MNRRKFVSAPVLGLPVLAGAQTWNIVDRSKLVDITYQPRSSNTPVKVRCMPFELWFGATPMYLSKLWYVGVLAVQAGGDRRLDIPLDSIKSTEYAV